jgi:hypothetical protein
MPAEWNLHYEGGWTFADGEPHLSVGEIFDWDWVGFGSQHGLVRVEEKSKSAIPIADFLYRVLAELIYTSEKACINDFGLRAIGKSACLRPRSAQGDYVSGNISISLPGYTELGVPGALLQTLERGISADLTPYVERSPGDRSFIRDESRIHYEQVSSTQSVDAPWYILHCSEAIE